MVPLDNINSLVDLYKYLHFFIFMASQNQLNKEWWSDSSGDHVCNITLTRKWCLQTNQKYDFFFILLKTVPLEVYMKQY